MAPLPDPSDLRGLPKTVFFPGSTIGNLTPDEAVALLRRIRSLPDVTALILGADLIKEASRLIDAYDDAQGVTAAFNLNLLQRINQETGADFDLGAFRHQARWDDSRACIEMHLVSTKAQTVTIAQPIGVQVFHFEEGESIHTEKSHKYSRTHLTRMAELSGWKLSNDITAPANDFSVCILTPGAPD